MSERGHTTSTLIQRARLVAVGPHRGAPLSAVPADIRIREGRVQAVAPRLPAEADEQVIDAAGRWAIPGLWDMHVHLLMWAQSLVRLDLSGTKAPAEVTRIVGDHIAAQPAARRGSLVTGYGYRSGTWSRPPTVEELDTVSRDVPVVLVSGDAHNGWLNSRALQQLGLPPRDGVLDESEWFEVLARLQELPDSEGLDAAYRKAVDDAAAKGVVGVVDLEFAAGYRDWPERFARGVDSLRVRVGTYPDRLEEVRTAGLRSGDELPGGDGLLTMGPLKIISDGSLNTCTAYCHEPYAHSGSERFPRGKQNYSVDDLAELMRGASHSDLDVAVHAVGDAAVTAALDAFAATGAKGSVEHAQLMTKGDIARMARLGVRASVQPAHLLDDRDVTAHVWPDRADRCFPLRSLLHAGVQLALGSDAPVAQLDPWLAMAAAVHRSADEREPWNPAESLTAAQALAASVDGQGTLAPGSRGDVVLLEEDPLRTFKHSDEVGKHLRAMPVAATFVAGRATYQTF